MSQENSGEPVLLTARDKMLSVERQVEEYLTRKGVFNFKIKNEAESFMNMTKQEIHGLTKEECGEAGVILSSYAGFLQEVYNKELARVNWADAEIRRVIAGEINQYKATSYEERKSQAIAGNEYAAKLQDLRTWAQVVADRLAFTSHRIETMSRAFLSLQQSKRN